MARPRKNTGGGGQSTLSAGQAQYVLDRLISERRISPGEINRYVGEMGREISDLERRLAQLREAAGPAAAAAVAGLAAGAAGAAVVRRGRRPGRPPGRPAGRPGRPAGRRRGRPPASAAGAATPAAGAQTGTKGGAKRGRRAGGAALSPEQLASRQLQGRYLAQVRRFPANRRAQFAKTAKEKGREAAIKEMEDALKK